MFRFIIEIILWSLCIYGILSLIKDVFEASTYNKISENVKLILTVKDVGFLPDVVEVPELFV